MIDGPGPPSTLRFAVVEPSARVAVMCRVPEPTRDAQRILLLYSRDGGDASGCAQTIATMAPLSPSTYGIRGLGSEKPSRAQVGSTPLGTGSTHVAGGGDTIAGP